MIGVGGGGVGVAVGGGGGAVVVDGGGGMSASLGAMLLGLGVVPLATVL